MSGTSLLAMPWAIKQAGFVTGIVLLMFMAVLMTYTAYVIVNSVNHLPEPDTLEFSDVVRIYLGRAAEIFGVVCSVSVMLGAAIVYWILMTDALYNGVIFIYEAVHEHNTSRGASCYEYENAVCESDTDPTLDLPDSVMDVWDDTSTVPLFLVLLLFPLMNFKSPTFFTKFTASGAIFLIYVCIFVTVKAGIWGFRLSFDNSTSLDYTENFSATFPALTGVAAMAFFLHNSFISIMRLQKHPENNTRDLVIAFTLVCGTYVLVGAVFYASFPLDKDCVQDNLLDNLVSTDVMAFVARLGILLQLTCVLPLVVYIMRIQIMLFFFNTAWPGLMHILVLNTIVVIICVLFAIFLPRIGRIISFVGAFCGFSYGIALPCLVYIVSSRQRGTLTTTTLVIHSLIIFLGVANFTAQFAFIGETS